MSNHKLLFLIGLLTLALTIVATCSAAAPLTTARFNHLGQAMMDIEWTRKTAKLDQHALEMRRQVKATASSLEQGRLYFELGYTAEFRETTTKPDAKSRSYQAAQNYYLLAVHTGSAYGTQATYRLGVLGALKLLGPGSRKIAVDAFRTLAKHAGERVWVRQQMPSKKPPAALDPVELAGAKAVGAGNRADLITSPAAALEQGPVLQAQPLDVIARVRWQQLASGR